MRQSGINGSFLLAFVAIQFLQLGSQAEDFSQYRDANALWQRIQEISRSARPEHEAASEDEAKKLARERLGALDDAISAFNRRFSDDHRRWDARLILLGIAPILASLTNTAGLTIEETEAALNEIVRASGHLDLFR